MFHYIAVIVSCISAILLIKLSFHTESLRKGFLFISLGYVISVLIHSVAEYLESVDLLSHGVLIDIMPLMISFGSLMIIWGILVVNKSFVQPINELKEIISTMDNQGLNFSPGKHSSIGEYHGEIGSVSRSLFQMFNNLKKSKGNLSESDKKLKLAVRGLEDKLGELERINKIVLKRELSTVELKEKLKEVR